MPNNGQKYVLFELVVVSFLFLVKLQLVQTWNWSPFLHQPELDFFNCTDMNLTNCSFCSPGTIYNMSKTTLSLKFALK